jgi:hypothetical protein
MKPRTATIFTALAAAGVLAIGPALAASMHNLPEQRSQGSVTYMTGGIGADEAAAMKREESKFPLSLEFVQRAKPRDEFLANVAVTIKDRAGKTELQTTADGPLLLAKLPAGKYTVSAEENGKTKTQQVVIAANKPEHLIFEWR